MKFSAQQLCPYHNQPTASQIFHSSKRDKKFCFFCQMHFAPLNLFCQAQSRSEVAKRLWDLRYNLSLSYAQGTYSHGPEEKFPQMTNVLPYDEDGTKRESLRVILLKITPEDAELLVGQKKLTKEPVDQFYLALNARESYVFTTGAVALVPRPHVLMIHQEGKWGSMPYYTHGWRVK